MIMESKVLLAEPEGGDLHDEDRYQLLREVRELRHQVKDQRTPHSKQPARPVNILAVQDGNVGGTLGQPLTAAPTAGGVLRWGLARALTK